MQHGSWAARRTHHLLTVYPGTLTLSRLLTSHLLGKTPSMSLHLSGTHLTLSRQLGRRCLDPSLSAHDPGRRSTNAERFMLHLHHTWLVASHLAGDTFLASNPTTLGEQQNASGTWAAILEGSQLLSITRNALSALNDERER